MDGKESDISIESALAGLSGAELSHRLLDLVHTETAHILDCDNAEIGPGHTFQELGLDSLTAVELRDRLDRATGLRLPSTLIFDCPTPESLAEYLRAHTENIATADLEPTVPVAVGDDPVAIVGMACRFPGGADSPEELWSLVTSGGDAISKLPTDRGWNLEKLYDPDPDRPGTLYVRGGGFLEDATGFDAGFFGISPREALAMDPQQRLLLEVSWEAVERAGIDPASLKGSATGVFTGQASFDYPAVVRNVPEIDMYYTTGTHASVASGRVAYALGLEGPAVTVDTACSSSLVALHLAVQALRAGECTLALAGGATVLSGPSVYLGFCRQRALSVDGRCRAFAEGSDGFGPAEGVGVLVVERLSDARRNGHRILAVVRGSAVNQDGASNGLTAPNGPSQQRVIRQALTTARLTVADVDLVEAHGTGTTLGDPIEAQALLATYGQREPGQPPLLLGSVKSNIGHTQAAAGVAGVIKTVMALQHATVPATLHVDQPTSHVDWTTGAVRLATETTHWPDTGRPRRAAVSSFGMSGTNAHVILEQAPTPDEESQPTTASLPTGAVPWVLSARTPEALREQAARLGAYAETHPDDDPARIAAALIHSRASFEHRAAVIVRSHEDALTGLTALATSETAANVVTGLAIRNPAPVFVFPGQGSQWAGMGRELLATSPVFADWINQCETAFAPHTDWSLTPVLRGDHDAASLDRVDVVQPALFAVLTGIAHLWQHHGITPTAVLGHSQGEIAAAYVAGALTLHDAARIVTLRSKALTQLAGTGTMASLMLSRDTTEKLLHPWQGRITVAAANGPQSTIISGDTTAIEELLHQLETDGTWARRIPVDYASHSPHIEAIRDTILTALNGITPQPTDTPFYSTLTGDRIDTTQLDADYWYRNLRHTVEFHTTTHTLLDNGHRLFIETSPHPVLTTALQQTIEDTSHPATVLESLRRDHATLTHLTTSLTHAHTHGATPHWNTLLPTTTPTEPHTNPHTDLPTYPFQHQHYWPDTSPSAPTTGNNTSHPLLATVLESAATNSLILSGRIALDTHPWLADHAVADTVILPGTAFLELALHAAREAGCHLVEELTLETPLTLPDQGAIHIQVAVEAADETGARAVTVHSRPDDAVPDTPWTRHAAGTVTYGGDALPLDADSGSWPPAGAQPVDIGDFYAEAARHGYGYGPAFQGLSAVWRQGNELFAEALLPEGQHADSGRFGLHPALLDSALHPTMLSRASDEASGQAWLPFVWSGVSLHAAGAAGLRIRMTPVGTDAFAVELADGAGRPVAAVRSLVSRPVTGDQLALGRDTLRQALFQLTWTPLPVSPTAPAAAAWAVLGADSTGVSEAVATAPVHADLAALRGSADSAPEVVIVPCADPGGSDAAQTALGLTGGMLDLLQQWLADERWADSRLVVLTSGAVATGPQEEVSDLAAASVRGLLRSASSEHPGRFLLVDTDGTAESRDVLPAAVVAATARDETELALRHGRVLLPRLTRCTEEAWPQAAHPGTGVAGTVVITGGTGTLGGLVARHLVREHKVPHVVLIGRSGRAARGVPELAAELAGLGAKLTVAACDATDRAALAEVLAAIPAEHPLTGVVHAAGVLEDGTLESLTAERLERVMAPKVRAGWNLHELTRHHPLSMFVLFSSASGVLGTAGQANYAAANTFLDALAQHRRAQGLAATSLAWGFWEQASGMTAHLADADLAWMSRTGVLPLSTSDGLALFDAGLGGEDSLLVPVRLNLARIQADADRVRVPSVLRGLVRPPIRRATDAGSPAAAGETLARRLRGLSPTERERLLVDLVSGKAAEVLGRSGPAEIDEELSFRELGFESLTAVELRNRLGAATGLRLPATLVFDHPSPAAIGRHLLTLLVPDHDEVDGAEKADGADLAAPAVTGTDQEDAFVCLDELDVDELVRMALDSDRF